MYVSQTIRATTQMPLQMCVLVLHLQKLRMIQPRTDKTGWMDTHMRNFLQIDACVAIPCFLCNTVRQASKNLNTCIFLFSIILLAM